MRKTKQRQKIDYDVMSDSCDVIVIFQNYGQFGAIRKLDSGRKSVKLMLPLIVTYYLTKTQTRTKKSLTQLSHYCFK